MDTASKFFNWNVIAKEIKKFGIEIDRPTKQKLIERQAFDLVKRVLFQLYEFDKPGKGEQLLEDIKVNKLESINRAQEDPEVLSRMFSRENSNNQQNQATAILPKKIKVNNVSEGVENLSKVTNINYISAQDELEKSSTVL